MKKLKLFKLLLVAILTLVSVVPISQVKASTLQEEHYIIGVDGTFAPFTFVDNNNELAGIEIDIFKAIAEDQGIDYEFQIYSFSAALQALESNQIDGMIGGMAATPERKRVFDFSEPHSLAGNQFAVKADSEINDPSQLKGKVVAAKSGTKGLELAEQHQDEYGYEIAVYDDSANMYEAVMVGNADACIETSIVMAYAIATGQVDLKQIGEDMDPTGAAFAVNGGQNPELLEAFNQGLANIKADGTYDEIYTSYLGEAALATQQQNNQSSTGQYASQIASGLWTTIWVSVVAILIAMILGVILGLMRVSDNNFLNLIATIYIDFMRGIPMLVFIFFVYFGVAQWFGVNFTPAVAGTVALGINSAAYMAEIFRGGINSIPKGQVEAARSLGLPKSETMKSIVLPQATRLMVPSFINQFVITLKNTSILSVIGMVELTQAGKLIISRTYQSGNVWLVIGIVYVVLITALTKLSDYIDRKTKVHN